MSDADAKRNVLISSAGRRVELVGAFKQAAQKIATDSLVIACDVNPGMSAACQVADISVQVPRADSPDYIESLLLIAEQNKIGLIIPTVDTELIPLAASQERFADEGIHVSVPELDFVMLCRDKRKSAKLFSTLDIDYPRIQDPRELTFPCFVKPVSGSSSAGAKLLKKKSDVLDADLSNSGLMFMDFIGPEYDEFTVDAYFDLSGSMKCLVPRQRIETRAGEISKGITRKGPLYAKLVAVMDRWKGARGCITLQLFYNSSNADMFGIEVNPRFGGGFPLAHAAGADYPLWILQELFSSQKTEFFDTWEENLLMLRYDAKVMVHGR
jgi:carbamoyl-phosphate synthase large subunit